MKSRELIIRKEKKPNVNDPPEGRKINWDFQVRGVRVLHREERMTDCIK